MSLYIADGVFIIRQDGITTTKSTFIENRPKSD